MIFRSGTPIIVVAMFLISLALFLAIAHAYGSTQIGGLRHWVLHDDFMISERYARNLARGRALVFNPASAEPEPLSEKELADIRGACSSKAASVLARSSEGSNLIRRLVASPPAWGKG
jgi:hypothetical protein